MAVQPVTIVAPHDAAGTGVTGSVDVEVTPGGTGPIELGTTGLSVGTVQGEAVAVNDQHYEYAATVAEGAVFARFDLDVLDDELENPVDFDLFVYLLNDEGTPTRTVAVRIGRRGSGASTSGAGRRQLPRRGARVRHRGPGGRVQPDHRIRVVPGGAPVAFDPAVLDGVQGEPIGYTASWAGLTPFTTYVGLITYGEERCLHCAAGRDRGRTAPGRAREPGRPIHQRESRSGQEAHGGSPVSGMWTT